MSNKSWWLNLFFVSAIDSSYAMPFKAKGTESWHALIYESLSLVRVAIVCVCVSIASVCSIRYGHSNCIYHRDSLKWVIITNRRRSVQISDASGEKLQFNYLIKNENNWNGDKAHRSIGECIIVQVQTEPIMIILIEWYTRIERLHNDNCITRWFYVMPLPASKCIRQGRRLGIGAFLSYTSSQMRHCAADARMPFMATRQSLRSEGKKKTMSNSINCE